MLLEKKIKVLKIQGYFIESVNDEELINVINSIKINTSIEELNINHVFFEKILSCFNFQDILFNKKLKILDLSNNNIFMLIDGHYFKLIETFCEFIQNYMNVEYLNLFGNCLGDNENCYVLFFNALKTQKYLKKINLGNNNINEESCCISISTVLKENNILEEIDLRFNYIGNTQRNIELIIEGLESNTTLKHLNLKQNWISNDNQYSISLQQINHKKSNLDILI